MFLDNNFGKKLKIVNKIVLKRGSLSERFECRKSVVIGDSKTKKGYAPGDGH